MDSFPHPYTIADALSWINLMLKQNPILVFVIDIDGKLTGAIGLDMRCDIYGKAPLLVTGLLKNFGEEVSWLSGKADDQLCPCAPWYCTITGGYVKQQPNIYAVREKAGFIKEGIMRNGIIKNGVVLDKHVYGIVKAQM